MPKRKTLKQVWLIFVNTFFLLAIAILLHSKWHIYHSPPKLLPVYEKALVQLALLSLETRDVPVSSVLVYNGKIIGKGYNTVARNAKAGEHAEINAISDALASLGLRQFMALNRDSLCLISTFEPCLMCAGAMVVYNVQKAYFLKEKSLADNLRQEARLMRYYLWRASLQPSSLQDSLFHLHPDFPKAH